MRDRILPRRISFSSAFLKTGESLETMGMENMQKQGFLPLPGASSTFDMHGHNEMGKADAIDEFFRMAG